MNDEIISSIAKELNVNFSQVKNTLELLQSGNTVPFIARYRKEVTGALDEEQIRKINEVYEYQVNLLKRKEDIIKNIDKKGMLTDNLKAEIMACLKLVEVEDIYLPYKEKKKTKATEAIANGLEPLAKKIMSFDTRANIYEEANKYLTENVKSIDDAIAGAKYIISEWVSDNAKYRKYIRENIYNFGSIESKLKKNVVDEDKTFTMYYDYTEKIKCIKPHRVLALDRGEDKKILSVNLKIDTSHIMDFLYNKVIKNYSNYVKNKASLDENLKQNIEQVMDAIADSYKRLIFPSIEREIRSSLSEAAQKGAIELFGKNLEKLLLTPPMKDKIVLGFDPAFRTGCKLAVIDKTSNVLNISKIYPHEPQNKWNEAKDIIKNLISKYNVDIIAVGNGTASRESEKLVAEVCTEYTGKKIEYIIVSEAGASVYSASNLAISEFPNLHVEERSAISIGRRLQDALSELVKIDPKSIGVGQYQYDVNQKELSEALDFVVQKCVNAVGVNINTASPCILKYISGLNKSSIDKLVSYREKNGKIMLRGELLENKILSSKVYEQSIGFMRINGGKNILDETSIHPESYSITMELLKNLNLNVESIGKDKLIEALNRLDIQKYSLEKNIAIYTLEDIIKCLKMPLRDYREDFVKPVLKSNILNLEDLNLGMKLEGTIRNVVDFGAFVDIGLHDCALLHISKMSKEYIKHPLDVVSVGDIVTCYVSNIDMNRKKVNVSLFEEGV